MPYADVFDDSFEDMPRRVPDIGKIRRCVGYSPTVHLDEIIENVVEYLEDPARLTRRASVDTPEQPGGGDGANGVVTASIQSGVVDFG